MHALIPKSEATLPAKVRNLLAVAPKFLPSVLYMMLLALVAISIRFYNLSHHLLWLDELYAYQLAQLGLKAILLNSLVDPHPPLFYLMLWVTSGFDLLHNEWSWRWLAAISAPLLLYLILIKIVKIVTPRSAFLGCLLLALSPIHLYFSQEARSTTFDTFISTLSMWLLYKIAHQQLDKKMLAAYSLTLLLGLYSSYSFAMIAGVQWLYIIFILRKPTFGLSCALLLLLSYWPAMYLGFITLSQVAAKHTNSKSITLAGTINDLLSGPYQLHQQASINGLVVLLCVLALVGAWQIRNSTAQTYVLYCLMQLILPVVLIFCLLMGLLGINLPSYEARQFVILLPSLFVLITLGIDHLTFSAHANKPLLIVIAVVYLLICAYSLSKIKQSWSRNKYEAHLPIEAIAQQLQQTDGIISLHHSLNAALSFYLPDSEPYSIYQKNKGQYRFAQSNLFIPAQTVELDYAYSIKNIHAHPRIWLIYRSKIEHDLQQALLEGCHISNQQNYGIYRVMLLEQCQP